jgi:hypothetical protein
LFGVGLNLRYFLGMSESNISDDQNERIGVWLEFCYNNKIQYKSEGYSDLLERMEDEESVVKDTVVNTLIETVNLHQF